MVSTVASQQERSGFDHAAFQLGLCTFSPCLCGFPSIDHKARRLIGDSEAVSRHELQKLSGKLGVDILQGSPFMYEECSRRLSESDTITPTGTFQKHSAASGQSTQDAEMFPAVLSHGLSLTFFQKFHQGAGKRTCQIVRSNVCTYLHSHVQEILGKRTSVHVLKSACRPCPG